VRSKRIERLIGRDEEIDRTVKILSRCTKNNPVFVGEAGVGKTAVAEGLAYRIVNNEVPEGLADCVIHALDLTALIAGARYRGDFEERMQEVMKEAMADPNIILFIDEIHTIMGAGSSNNSVDAANILKPALARGMLRCMGATTRKEYRQIFEVDAAMARRFQMVEVDEPSRDDTLLILQGVVTGKMGKHHNVDYTPEALEAAVDLSVRYLHNRKLPDKAIDVIDEAGAIYSSAKRGPSGTKALVTESDIRVTVSKMARVPVTASTTDEREVMRNLEDTLSQSVFGQAEAVKTLSQAVKLAKNGLRDPEKPLGSFLFTGPSGVGKTELSRQLSSALGLKLMRFDMSEYMEKHTASRLIGAPPGYVGHGSGGLLTETVNETPHGILLLDEIEKAHPDIFNLLLQVMDRGKLTDGNGREVDFRNTIIIMTSNVGASQVSKETIGFGVMRQEEEGPSAAQTEALSQAFSPEFRNRLDGIIQFNPLSRRSMGLVVDKQICQMEVLLRPKQITLTLTEAARDWISEKGYSREMGARPVDRVITKHIKHPLSDEMLSGNLDNGGNVRVDVTPDGKDLKLICEPVALPALMPAE
jgi:ATP-dependent Clp protease ATP-binding subunit ClpA